MPAEASHRAPASARRLRVLTLSSLFPNGVQPRHGVFVEERLRHLRASGAIESRVIAPVPYFPFRAAAFGDYARFAEVPRQETRDAVSVAHPRYLVIPKLGMSLAPALFAAGARSAIAAQLRDGWDFDLIDAHYFYPDGVAAALLGRSFGKPVVITARGSDVNLLPEYALPRRWILWAAARCAAIITVSAALKRRLAALGVAEQRVTVLRNGVDLDTFRPLARPALRARLGLDGPTVLSAGLLVEAKGHHLAIEALTRLAGVQLVIAGDGPMARELRALAERLGVSERVRFTGNLARADLIEYYNAADALVLASAREGMPNVVLEALACGTPVVAADVGGVAEIVDSPHAGVLLAERSAAALAGALTGLLERPPPRYRVREHALRFDWAATVAGQLALFRQLCAAAPEA